LFLSQCSRFSSKEPIRGGIPIVYPWFGPKAGQAQHGFARRQRWELKEFAPARDGSVGVRFQLPPSPEAAAFPRCRVEYIVTVSAELKLELVVTNQSQDVFAFEDCLHTYFVVGDVSNISIRGLKGVEYLDKLKDYARAKETEELLRLNGEIDRTYVNTPGPVEIFDGELWRKIRIEKTSSASTVVWNPWAARAQQLADLGNEEYRHMVCVESGNIGENKIKLPPGGEHRLAVTLATERV
ncbi:MAG TPA: D-hexose-6-phosphate mutarotase, partial [Verrucomicrobiae bacterium]|nr:D-hexose-6-phosphate mutarotase [Verrucomicrobiae bacterium]